MPTRNFSILIASIIAIVLIGAGGYSALKEAFNFGQYVKNKEAEVPAFSVLYNEENDRDSDSDGLKDWEEVLLGTNPYNSDSDGDGIPDNDDEDTRNSGAITIEVLKNSDGISELPENLTRTDLFAQEFFAKYLTEKVLGNGEISEDATNRIIDSASKVMSGELEYKKYTVKDISLVNTTSSSDIKKYGSDMGLLMKELGGEKSEDPLLVFEQAVNGDDEAVEKLIRSVNEYDVFIKKALLVKVPIPASEIHLSVLNTMSKLKVIVQKMSVVEEDPIESIVGADAYPYLVGEWFLTFTDVQEYFIKNNITYKSNEDGRYFTNLF